MSAFYAMSVRELGSLLRSGSMSSEEITGGFLERIDRARSSVNCFLSIENIPALEQSRIADRELSRGVDRGALHGIPVAIKDIFERTGHEVTAGSRPFSYVADRHATVIEKLADAGAVILGTLNMDEFAAGGTGDNAHFGRCRNPWNPSYQSGGSSGGSAAAVAAGLAPVSLGSDAGGSIRIPAAYCGVTGLKPTYGRVSRFGAYPRTWSMDCIGPLAVTAEDCSLMLSAISGPDPRDPSCPADRSAFAHCLDEPPDSVHIGAFSPHARGCATLVADGIKALKAAGFELRIVESPGIGRLNDLQQVLVKCEAAALHGPKIRQASDALSADFRSVVQEGFCIPATTYIEALSLRTTALKEFVGKVFDACDALLMPVTPGPVPIYDPAGSEEPAVVDAAFSESARFTRFANYLGLPAVSYPCGFDDRGLPRALQLIGRPWAEGLLLRIVHRLQLLDPPTRFGV